MRRKLIPKGVETSVLAKSARRCALYFHLDGDLKEKLGQIAHLDGNRGNSAEENLAFMCLEHHTLFDSRTSQHRNYTVSEVKQARNKLYDLVGLGKHVTADAALPYRQAEADKKALRDFLEMVPSNGTIAYLRHRNFAGYSFDWNRLSDIERFNNERNGPDCEFLDPELEKARSDFRKSCHAFLVLLVLNTFPTHSDNRQSVPSDWEIENPKRFNKAVDQIHKAADLVCTTYDNLVRLGRRKLAV